MIPGFWQSIIREQKHPLSEGEKEEIAQSGGFTVHELEKFLEGLDNAQS